MMHNTGMKSGLAETATGALSVEGPQPVWMTLNEARDRAFTGEVVFEVDPEVLAYFDNGIVYYAERVTDVSLGRRLLDAGVLDAAQLERGTVRVGDVEHLGRLFDRDATVDRDAVLVVTESSTEDLIADLANREIASVRVTAYRHHPCGVHRWFVAPIEHASVSRPTNDIAPIGADVADDLSSLSMLEAASDELVIEWDEPFEALDQEAPTNGFATSDPIDEFVMDLTAAFDADTNEDVPVDEFVDTHDQVDIDDVVAIEPMSLDIETDAETNGQQTDDFEFNIVWPDGSEESATEQPLAEASVDEQPMTDWTLDTAEPASTSDALLDDRGTDADDAEAVVPEPQLADVADPGTSDPSDVQFEMPALDLGEVSEDPDAEVSDDVADAVRAAILAIESATTETPVVASPAPTLGDAEAVPAPAPQGLGAFAPPTMDMRAEVIYGQVETTEDSSEIQSEQPQQEFTAAPEAAVAESGPTEGVASVVFVDDENDERGDNERSSALRRLIGSLRRKDR